jgi:membrane-anchored glycerophosphoryl diester phosphodiesterase (GDPDase)
MSEVLKPQSIRNNVKITWNGDTISKQEIIDMSVLWNDKQILFFKKMLKQGGTVKIENNNFKIVITEPILTSKGVKDGGIQQVDPEARF